MANSPIGRIQRAIHARRHLFTPPHRHGFRLYNGFTEGSGTYVIDILGRTAVIHDYSIEPSQQTHSALIELLERTTPFVACTIFKLRKSDVSGERNGIVKQGARVDTRVEENGVWFALDISMNRDASFYVDTRNLRRWATESLCGKSVLNTFAYTGSIGVAAMAAGASVVQTDLNRTFLNLSKQSCAMNGFPVVKRDFICGDFFVIAQQLKRQQRKFDCVILDPPFFSTTSRGTVDLERHMIRIINKARPLVRNGGQIVAVNNAVFLSGRKFMDSLDVLCSDGYVSINSRIDIPEDCIGYSDTISAPQLIDPAPFNHSTKIAVLNIHHRE